MNVLFIRSLVWPSWPCIMSSVSGLQLHFHMLKILVMTFFLANLTCVHVVQDDEWLHCGDNKWWTQWIQCGIPWSKRKYCSYSHASVSPSCIVLLQLFWWLWSPSSSTPLPGPVIFWVHLIFNSMNKFRNITCRSIQKIKIDLAVWKHYGLFNFKCYNR